MTIVGTIAGGHINMPAGDTLFVIKAVALILYMGFISAGAYTLWGILLKYNPVSRVSVLGFINLWEKTSDRCYLSAAEDVMRYIRRYIADTRPGGEWYWGAHANRRPMKEQDIVSEWKCPYHSGRMCLEIIKRSKASA